ncbi:putative Ser/Thr protein phosphatase family protein [Peptoniphilus sp. ING2-D1G]|nr:putative Ser/Thr protein phosphatase family protein [Peptoniphilus sp. ING2-D1G]
MKILFILILVFLCIYNYFQISKFKVYTYNVYTNKIRNNLRIIRISDFHDNALIDLKKLKKSIEDFDPHLVFLTGDIISRNTSEFSNISNFLNCFCEYDTYFVNGNHELENELKNKLYMLLKRHNIKDLNNSGVCLSLFNDKIFISGISFENNEVEEPSKESYNILACHNPQTFIASKTANYDLVLSGHKHGGQVRLPYFGQIIDHDFTFFPKYSKGLYKIKNTYFNIDSGLGQNINLRLNCKISYSRFKVKPIK